MKKRVIFVLAGVAALISALVLSCSNNSAGPDGGCTKPPAPSVVMASAQSKSSIKLEWAAVKNAETYSVYRADNLNGKYSRVGTVLSTSFTDTGLTPTTTYYYKISAENDCGEGAMSTVKDETTQTCPTPSAPQISAAALSSTSIKISWGKVSSLADSYTVYHSTSEGGTYDSIANTPDTAFSHTGLTPASTHYYKVAGRNNNCGKGAESNRATATAPACTSPATPTNVTAATTAPSATSIRISWDAIPNAASYKIYRSSGGEGTYQLIDTTEERTFTNTGLTPTTTYYYKITAANNCGESAQSAYASATTETCPPPAAPTNVSADMLSSTKITVSWDQVNTAVTYKIYRSATSTGTYAPVGSTSGKTGTAWTDEGLNPSTTYYYKITAESECRESEMSTSYGVGTTDCVNAPTVAPTNVKAETLSQNEIEVSWDAVSGVMSTDRYHVYYSESQNGVYRSFATTSVSFTSMNLSGLEPSTTYYFRVSTQNNCGESERSTSTASATTEVCDLPTLPDPTGISATTLSARSVEISWNAVSGASEYIVYRGTERYNSPFSGVGGRITGNSFTDTTVSASTTYYYSVMSVNACGARRDGNLGEVVEATTLCETPIPTSVAAAAKSSSSIEITWTAVPNAVSYAVYGASTQNGTYTLVDRTTSNSFTNTGLSNATTYHYKVTAKTATCDESRQSVSVNATTQ